MSAKWEAEAGVRVLLLVSVTRNSKTTPQQSWLRVADANATPTKTAFAGQSAEENVLEPCLSAHSHAKKCGNNFNGVQRAAPKQQDSWQCGSEWTGSKRAGKGAEKNNNLFVKLFTASLKRENVEMRPIGKDQHFCGKIKKLA